MRVAIEESDDSEEEETTTGIKSKFPLNTPKDIDEHNKKAKKLMQQGADAFMKKFENKAKAKIVETEVEPKAKPAAPKKSEQELKKEL